MEFKRPAMFPQGMIERQPFYEIMPVKVRAKIKHQMILAWLYVLR
jgi:hypothetical protein